MDPKLIEADDVVRAARSMDLELAPDHVPGVVKYYKMIAGMAGIVNEFALGDSDEHAALFVPCSPPARD
jgi:hypothetical protein